MTQKEITKAIETALIVEGFSFDQSYVDVPFLVVVNPEKRWKDSLYTMCRIVVTENSVQKYERRTPYNFTTGNLVGERIKYDTIEQMVEAVKTLSEPKLAACWK